MDELRNASGTVLTFKINNFSSSLKGNRIERRLLDGTYHIQTIGEPTREISFTAFSHVAEVAILNLSVFQGEELKLQYEDTIYTGSIRGALSWGLDVRGDKNGRLYKTKVVFVVSSSELVI